ncbi:fused response regulator/phosphatase [Bowmanella denitrificans]|uniref:Fused response regulator/phosphatase n=1 Tax=Bowmanella denitrificans TaxID=366582 RepID=A0ABN0X6M7_9ALTE
MDSPEFFIEAPEDHTKVLLVEDNGVHSKMLTAYFLQNGLNCDVAANLAEARSLAAGKVYDIVLLDNHLPDGLGIEFIDVLTQLGIDIPVMMITSDDDYQLIQSCFERGISDFMPKPLHLPLLLFKMQRLIFNYWLQQNVQVQNNRLEELLGQKQQEEKLARHVYEHLSAKENSSSSFVHSLMQPSSAFNGDLLLSRLSPGGNLFVLLLDATGHGLAAAISILPVVSVFRAMVSKGCPLSMLAYELNHKLTKEIPGDRFVAGILIELDPHRKELNLWNGGMPEALLCDADGHIQHRFVSRHMPLGVLEAGDFDAGSETIAITPAHEQLFMFSDGLIEQLSATGELFGIQRVERLIERSSNSEAIVNLDKALRHHCQTREYNDDVSICRIDIQGFMHEARSASLHDYYLDGRLHIASRFCGYQLAEMDLLAWLNSILQASPMKPELRQRVFTVSAELISNAVDHGVLKLDSVLKNGVDGFITYIEQKEQRTALLAENDWVELALDWVTPSNEVTIRVKDSGQGYSLAEHAQADVDDLSGRGLSLVRTLASVFQCEPPGNQTTVLIR